MTEQPTFPVVECFGPTVQGEGPSAGKVTHFLRLGGCDYRCSWCDTMYAVDPRQWKDAPRMTAEQIDAAIPEDAHRLIVTGGNPGIHKHFGDVLMTLEESATKGRRKPLSIELETQGTIWQPWMTELDLLVVSPKPPSSGMVGRQVNPARSFERFMEDWRGAGSWSNLALKIVVKDEADLWWACQQRSVVDPQRVIPFYFSAWSPPDAPLEGIQQSYRNLCEMVLAHRTAPAHEPILLPQLHAIAWGSARGV